MSRTKTPKSYDMVKNLLLENTPLCQDVINLIGGFVGNTTFQVGEEYIVDEALYDDYDKERVWDYDEPDDEKRKVIILSRTQCFCKIQLRNKETAPVVNPIFIKVRICLTVGNDEYFQIKPKRDWNFMYYRKSDQYFVTSNRERYGQFISDDLFVIKRIYCEDCDKEILEKSMKAHQNSKRHKKNIK